jgi:hypothetical protein
MIVGVIIYTSVTWFCGLISFDEGDLLLRYVLQSAAEVEFCKEVCSAVELLLLFCKTLKSIVI